jgi:RNA polymerase sigma-70 factor (ECF subfamily)
MSDERALFEQLFRETRGPLLGYLTRRAVAEDAADLLAEVYLVAWRRRDDLPTGEERRLWLFGVARRLLAEHHRIAGRRAQAENEVGGGRPGDAGADDRDAAVRAALESLTDLDRELVALTLWEGLGPAEAARVVGITPGTARVRLHRARARLARHPRLRALLADDDPEAAVVTAVEPASAW